MPSHAHRVPPARAVPLPAASLETPETLFNPVAAGVEVNVGRRRRGVGQQKPKLLVAPDMRYHRCMAATKATFWVSPGHQTRGEGPSPLPVPDDLSRPDYARLMPETGDCTWHGGGNGPARPVREIDPGRTRRLRTPRRKPRLHLRSPVPPIRERGPHPNPRPPVRTRTPGAERETRAVALACRQDLNTGSGSKVGLTTGPLCSWNVQPGTEARPLRASPLRDDGLG